MTPALRHTCLRATLCLPAPQLESELHEETDLMGDRGDDSPTQQAFMVVYRCGYSLSCCSLPCTVRCSVCLLPPASKHR